MTHSPDRVRSRRSLARLASLQPAFATPFRCHLTCGSFSALLIAITVWVWLNPQVLSTDKLHSQDEIDNAIQLVSHQERLQNQFNRSLEQARRNKERVERISSWLPRQRSWDNVRASIQERAETHGVQVVSLRRGKKHSGARLAVLLCHCELQCSYRNLCGFLHSLAVDDQPLWVDELRILRRDGPSSNRIAQEGSRDSDVECFAMISIRIPLVGENTSASMLPPPGGSHET